MKATRLAAILLLVSVPAGRLEAQNGHVMFRGTVAGDEVNNVVPVCYGDWFVTVGISQILDDPNDVLAALRSVDVCYSEARGLAAGDSVEVSGYYWGGICPRQYCGRVQLLAPSDYITPVVEYGDNDWMVDGTNLYPIPPGNVGIGTSQPQEKLHVVGNMLVQGASPAWLKLMASLGSDAGIALTSLGAGVNTWEILREGASADLRIGERFPYPPFSGQWLVVKARTGNVGLGTAQPDGKLHVLGDVLIQSATGADAVRAPLRVVRQGAGRQLLAYFSNPQDGSAEVDVQLAGGTMLPWGWSIKAASGMLTIGSVAVLPPALNVTSTGRLGISDTSPEYRLELPNTANSGGRGRANAWTTYSSRRWKTNVRPIENAMDKVMRLRGVSFDWKEGGAHDIGLIAEEVGPVVPEVVDYEANGDDATALAYDRLVALLIEALKEQQARIDELERAAARRDRLEDRLIALERLVRQQSPAR